MPTNMIAELAKAITPPEQPLDWNEAVVERNRRVMSIQFPDDYLEFGKVFGSGTFKNYYSWEIWSPARRTYPLIVLDFSRRTFDFKDATESNDMPFGIYPEMGGFLPFGSTPDGDYIGWVTKGRDPNAWKVVDFGRYTPGMCQELDMGFSEYLYNVLSRKIVLDRHQQSKHVWKLADATFAQRVFEDGGLEIE